MITSNAINSFNKSFADRAQLHNASLLVSEYTFSNTTNHGMLFSPFDPSVHKVTNVLEEAVKLFQAMKYKAIEVQNWNFGTNSWGASSFAQLSDPPVEFMSFATEALPPNIVLDDWAPGSLVTEGGDRFKWRTRHVTRWSWASPPINSKTEITESATFSTERFEIQNEKGENKIDVNGWYAVLPGETYKVRRFVRTAAMNFYNDTELLGEFISSTALRLDKTLSWEIGNAIQIDFIHDAGFEKAKDMLPITVSAGFGATTYTVSRATSS